MKHTGARWASLFANSTKAYERGMLTVYPLRTVNPKCGSYTTAVHKVDDMPEEEHCKVMLDGCQLCPSDNILNDGVEVE